MRSGGESNTMIQWILIGLLTAVAFLTDIRHHIIPNWLTVCGVFAGLSYHSLLTGIDGFQFSICGLLFGLVLLFILYVFGALGAGDVKLFAAFGAIAGMEFVMISLIYSLLYSGLIGISILIVQKKLLQRMFWVINSLFSFLILKEWLVLQSIPQNQLLRFPFMWAVLPAIFTYGLSQKGII
jgi:prepilin peptidase CpaA